MSLEHQNPTSLFGTLLQNSSAILFHLLLVFCFCTGRPCSAYNCDINNERRVTGRSRWLIQSSLLLLFDVFNEMQKNKNVKFELNSVWKLGRPRFADFLRHMTRALLQFCQRHLKEVLGPKPLIACSAKPLHSSHQQSLLHYGMAVVLVAAARVLAHWAETWC